MQNVYKMKKEKFTQSKLPILKSPNGLDYQIIGVFKLFETAKWINREEKYHWIKEIKYIETGEKLWLFEDSIGKIYKKSETQPEEIS